MPWKFNVTARSQQRERDYFLVEIATRVKFGSFTWNPISCASDTKLATVLDTTDAPELDGLRVGMAVKVIPPPLFPAGLWLEASVDADNTLTVIITNVTASAIDIAASTWAFMGIVL